jgi:hypothetical protein
LDLEPSDQYYLSDSYKREVLESMSVSQLIDTVLINPTVSLSPSKRDTGFTSTYSFQPLSNLVYTRDQQVRRVRMQLPWGVVQLEASCRFLALLPAEVQHWPQVCDRCKTCVWGFLENL